MKFYNRDFESCYDELITYYPRYYRDVREMVAILKAHGSLADGMQDNIEQVYFNNFIDYMDEDMITRWENFLGIVLQKSRTTEERRALIKAYVSGFGKISASYIEGMIKAYTGADVRVTFEPFDDEGNNCLYIDILRGDIETLYMSDILLLLSKKIPAHIYYRSALVYDIPGVVIGGGRKRRTLYSFHYPLSGTIPDDTLIGDLNAITAVIKKAMTIAKSTYDKAEADGLTSGTTPKNTTLASYLNRASVVEKSEQTAVTGFIQTEDDGMVSGITPVTIQAGVITEISAAAEATASACGIDYIYCGDGYAGAQS